MPSLGEEFSGDFESAESVIEDIPLVWVSQPHGVRAEKHRGGHSPGPIEGEGIHRLDHAIFDGVEELEIAGDFAGTKGHEFELAAGFFFDRAAPILEGLQPDAAGP